MAGRRSPVSIEYNPGWESELRRDRRRQKALLAAQIAADAERRLRDTLPKRRHAPRGGYDSSAKDDYRRRLYNYLRTSWKKSSTPIEDRTIAILDTSAAHETLHALRAGYQARNIWVADKAVTRRSRPAFKALFTQALNRAGFVNECHVYPGGDLLAVVEAADVDSAYKSGFDFINYDACAPVGRMAWLRYVTRLKNHVTDGGVFAITLLAGRETKETQEFIQACSGQEPLIGTKSFLGENGQVSGLYLGRLRMVKLAGESGDSHITRHLRAETYCSGRSPMMAVAFRVAANPSQMESRAALALSGFNDQEALDYLRWLDEVALSGLDGIRSLIDAVRQRATPDDVVQELRTGT